MIKRLVLALSVVLAMFGMARAEQVVVVELYTSQGCSSCPPADAILGQLAGRDNIIALALHVDYWDYLGWSDDLAEAAHSERQRAYARTKGKTMVYTPQMIVQGETHIVGTRSMDLTDAIRRHGRASAPVTVSLERAGDVVNVTARARGALAEGAVVQVVTYRPRETREIRRGENAGRTLTYHNVVNEWRTIGDWDGRAPYRAAVRIDDATPLAVIVQTPRNGPVLGAARLR